MDESYEFDVFVSHASEDKARFVEPLIAALVERGIKPWYDAHEIRLGDDFRRKMDEGLSRSRFGVVVLSPRFFNYWTEAELSALFNQERTFDETRILPVRCELDRVTLTRLSPLVAGRADISWEMGVAAIADRIRDRVRNAPAVTRSARSPVYNLPSRRARQLFGREPDLVARPGPLCAGGGEHRGAGRCGQDRAGPAHGGSTRRHGTFSGRDLLVRR